MTNKIPSIILLSILIAAICLSGCSRRHFGVGGLGLSGIGEGGGGRAEGFGLGSMGGLGAAPSQMARSGPQNAHFRIIASSDDPEEVNSKMMEVLEMCESEETTIKVYQTGADSLVLLLDTSIRQYMMSLEETRIYKDKIKSVQYNDEGKITFFMMLREEDEDPSEF